MATSAFKSTTKRTPIGTAPAADDSSSSNRSASHRRSRSLSRFSRRLDTAADCDVTPAPKGRFVNTVRGSGFPEISLDDLAIEFFESGNRGRSTSRISDVNTPTTTTAAASQRRGRSVSRHSSRVGDAKGSNCNSSGGGRVVSESNSRRRRSLSVVPCQISDSESQSSALTDDEARDARFTKNGIERTIRAVYSQKKAEHPTEDDVNSGLYEAMRKELRHAVEEIRMDLEQAMVKTKSSVSGGDNSFQSNKPDVLQAVSTIRRNYATKLEQSERRKQDLLAAILLEEQCGEELSNIGGELIPDPKNTVVVEKPPRTRKRSNDRGRMSEQLSEEAEKYFEDFISNVEDTDISSLDGERSDSSSTLGGTIKSRAPLMHCRGNETFLSPVRSTPVPVEMDGVALPWLQWETSTDTSPLSSSCKKKIGAPLYLRDAAQDASTQEQSGYSISSRGSWSPEVVDGPLISIGENPGSKYELPGSYKSQSFSGGQRKLQYHMEEYLKLQSEEDLLLERWTQRHRISSGSLLLCNETVF